MLPRSIAARIVGQRGNGLCNTNASSNEKPPAPNPLIVTVASGSLADTLRVRLLSNPQSTHAPSTPTAPHEIPHAPPEFQVRMTLANIINVTAHHTRRPMASLNAQAAMIAVATPSKLSNNEAVAAGVARRLNMSTMGAATPPANKAPMTHRRSALLICASASVAWALTRRSPR